MRYFGWVGVLLLGAAANAAAPPAEQWLPEGAVMALHVGQPGALIDFGADLTLPEALNSFTGGLAKLVDPLAAKAGTDRKGLLRKLTGGGVTYATYPGDISVVVVDATDMAAVQPVVGLAQMLARPAAAAGKGYYKEMPGATVWSLDGKQFWAVAGNRLIMTNRGEALKKLFEPHEKTLASWPLYAEAKRAAGEGTVATLVVNMALLQKAPAMQKALGPDGSPLDMILAGVVKEGLAASRWLALGFRVEGRSLLVHAAADGRPEHPRAAAFTVPQGPEQGVLPTLSVPGEVASASLWRDLHKFYAARESLFPEKTSGGILLENFMEIFFTGRDLTEEVFARFHPEVRLVAAQQKYDPAIGTPLEQYPAAALVFRVDRPEDFGEVFEEAWQKAIGITNFTRGQQALPGLIMDKATHGGVTFSYCYYSARNEKDRAHLPSRFNVRPALVRVGPYLIVSSTDGLAKDLIDALNREDGRLPATRPEAHTVLEVTGGEQIAALFEANRNELLRQAVVGKGKKPEAAAAEINANVALARMLDRVRLSIAQSAEGPRADLELRLK
jgi:hypothetical protein